MKTENSEILVENKRLEELIGDILDGDKHLSFSDVIVDGSLCESIIFRMDYNNPIPLSEKHNDFAYQLRATIYKDDVAVSEFEVEIHHMLTHKQRTYLVYDSIYRLLDSNDLDSAINNAQLLFVSDRLI